MILFNDPPLIFVHIPKTAGTAITYALKEQPCVVKMALDTHATALEIIKHVGCEVWDKSLTFGVVRNPWHQRVSCWLELRKDDKLRAILDKLFRDFAGWMRWIGEVAPNFRETENELPIRYRHYTHLRQIDYLGDENGNILVDKVLRFEEMPRAYELLCQEYKIPTGPINYVYVTRGHPKVDDIRPYDDWYTPETSAIISKVYAEDISRFGY